MLHSMVNVNVWVLVCLFGMDLSSIGCGLWSCSGQRQQLIRHACATRDLSHRLAPDLPCPILQYADDTLTLISATRLAITCLKRVLDDFASATGLAIEFHKSCFISMFISTEDASSMATTPAASVYLSPLPSSLHRPLLLSSLGLISASWVGAPSCCPQVVALFSAMLCLIISPLTLCALNFPPHGVVEAIDKRRRAFFWTGKDTCSGARCLIAWDIALLSKQEGGFGIRDLRLQNTCLILNFIH